MLQTFLPLFFMTFGICLFIVLMQFLWRYIDDLVGKGLSIPVVGEMFLYAALSLVPMALPLAILLASLMTFGNLGERFELLAMKAAGVSLIHIMRPLIITLCFICVGAFFFQNNVTPIAQVKLYTLLYSMRQKSPELDIVEGTFNKDITGYNVYVKKKDHKTGLLYDVKIYDFSQGFDNAQVIVADSGNLKVSANKMFLVLSLFNGESFENLKKQGGTNANQNVPYRRETFSTKEILIEFDANFTRMDDSFMQNQYIGKDLKNLQSSIDTMNMTLDSVKVVNVQSVVSASYKRTLTGTSTVNEPDTTNEKKKEPVITLNFDSIYKAETPSSKASLLARASSAIETLRSDNYFRAATLSEEAYKLRRHLIEWHKKFSLSFACLVFFFIGAPLGAIIRKGGLGMPVVISVFLFIFYYIIDNIGFKMARDGIWEAWQGIWLSSAILTPLGIFLTYKAVNDSVILNADTYINAFKNMFGKRTGRNIQKKEVIIFTPNYDKTYGEIQQLSEVASGYLSQNKGWVSYLSFWKRGKADNIASEISTLLDNIIEELSNSNQNLLLNKLMDYPVISGYDKQNSPFNGITSIITGIILPVGMPIYFIAMYQRKLLIQDIKIILKVNTELQELINKDNLEL